MRTHTDLTSHKTPFRIAMLMLLAGTAAGCTSGSGRFGSDDFYASATPNASEVDYMTTASVGPNGAGPVPPASVGNGGYAAAGQQMASAHPAYPGGGYQPSVGAPQSYPANAYGATNEPMKGASSVAYGNANAGYGSNNASSAPSSVGRQPLGAVENSSVAAHSSGNGSGSLGTMTVSSGDPKTQPVSASNQAASANSASGRYEVASGDTLSRISRQTGVSVAAIRSANNLSGDNVRIGQTLVIPGGNAAQTMQAQAPQPMATPQAQPAAQQEPVQLASAEPQPSSNSLASDSGQQLPTYTRPSAEGQPQAQVQAQAQAPASTEPQSSADEVASLGNDALGAAPEATGVGRLRWPVNGRVVRNYGSGNQGIDIAVPMGTAVRAAENGVVIYAGDGLKDLGNTVLVRHDDGLITVYGNASELSVVKGDTVARGQTIARAGTSGNAEAPQVHFEVRKDATPVDPTDFLEG